MTTLLRLVFWTAVYVGVGYLAEWWIDSNVPGTSAQIVWALWTCLLLANIAGVIEGKTEK